MVDLDLLWHVPTSDYNFGDWCACTTEVKPVHLSLSKHKMKSRKLQSNKCIQMYVYKRWTKWPRFSYLRFMLNLLVLVVDDTTSLKTSHSYRSPTISAVYDPLLLVHICLGNQEDVYFACCPCHMRTFLFLRASFLKAKTFVHHMLFVLFTVPSSFFLTLWSRQTRPSSHEDVYSTGCPCRMRTFLLLI